MQISLLFRKVINVIHQIFLKFLKEKLPTYIKISWQSKNIQELAYSGKEHLTLPVANIIHIGKVLVPISLRTIQCWW